AALSKPASANLWKDNESVDSVIEWNGEEPVRRIADKIRRTAGFDVAIFFATSWKPALAVWRADIPVRVGLRSGANFWLCNQHPAEPDRSLDPTRLSLHIAQSVGANVNELLHRAAS